MELASLTRGFPSVAGSPLEALQEPECQHVADVKVEDDGDLAKDQELVLSVSLAGQLDLTNKLSVAGSISLESRNSRAYFDVFPKKSRQIVMFVYIFAVHCCDLANFFPAKKLKFRGKTKLQM